MFDFFSKKKRKVDNTNSLLLKKLDRVIELLEQQQTGAAPEKNINLEHVQIDHLENIIFRLDNIEIDELSGKLLIGTNISGSEDFAASVIQKVDKQVFKQEAMADATSDINMSKEPITKRKAEKSPTKHKANKPSAEHMAEEDQAVPGLTKTKNGFRFRNEP